jgi:hypothetical protein
MPNPTKLAPWESTKFCSTSMLVPCRIAPSTIAWTSEADEMTALCLRILQAALVYVNTLMLQDVLAEEEWAAMLGPADRRGLTPLFWQHVRPYGEVRLDMGSRLLLGQPMPASADRSP